MAIIIALVDVAEIIIKIFEKAVQFLSLKERRHRATLVTAKAAIDQLPDPMRSASTESRRRVNRHFPTHTIEVFQKIVATPDTTACCQSSTCSSRCKDANATNLTCHEPLTTRHAIDALE